MRFRSKEGSCSGVSCSRPPHGSSSAIPATVPTWTLLLFLAAHQAIGHKEVRFLFPALLFAPFFIVRLAESLPPDFLRRRAVRVAGIVLAVVNGMIMIAALAVPGTNIWQDFRPGGTIGRERTAARLGASQEPEYVLLL